MGREWEKKGTKTKQKWIQMQWTEEMAWKNVLDVCREYINWVCVKVLCDVIMWKNLKKSEKWGDNQTNTKHTKNQTKRGKWCEEWNECVGAKKVDCSEYLLPCVLKEKCFQQRKKRSPYGSSNWMCERYEKIYNVKKSYRWINRIIRSVKIWKGIHGMPHRI